MNRRTTAAVRTQAGFNTPFKVETGVRQGAVVGPFLFNFIIDNIMRRTVEQFPADVVLAPSALPSVNLEYGDDVVILASNKAKLQHALNLVSKLVPVYGLRLHAEKCKQIWVPTRPSAGIREDGQPVQLVDEFGYLGCMLKNDGGYERDIKQRCAKTTFATTKCQRRLHHLRSQAANLPIRNASYHDVRIGDFGSVDGVTLMEKLDCTERKLFRRMLGYFWPLVCHNQEPYSMWMWCTSG
ncbi:hypothetical protein RB195_002210 [Necator americanus]